MTQAFRIKGWKQVGRGTWGRTLAAWWIEDADVIFESRNVAYRLYQERDDEASASRGGG